MSIETYNKRRQRTEEYFSHKIDKSICSFFQKYPRHLQYPTYSSNANVIKILSQMELIQEGHQ
jgi:hypothetical protein